MQRSINEKTQKTLLDYCKQLRNHPKFLWICFLDRQDFKAPKVQEKRCAPASPQTVRRGQANAARPDRIVSINNCSNSPFHHAVVVCVSVPRGEMLAMASK